MTAVATLAETAAVFLASWRIDVDALVPVPPSNAARKLQPVIEVATRISDLTGIPLCRSCVSKIKRTGQLKDLFEREARESILKGAFAVDRDRTAGKRILLFDDLFRSGATAGTITRLLLGGGAVARVYLLTLTQTRKNL